jgi:hypothetical protein
MVSAFSTHSLEFACTATLDPQRHKPNQAALRNRMMVLWANQ